MLFQMWQDQTLRGLSTLIFGRSIYKQYARGTNWFFRQNGCLFLWFWFSIVLTLISLTKIGNPLLYGIFLCILYKCLVSLYRLSKTWNPGLEGKHGFTGHAFSDSQHYILGGDPISVHKNSRIKETDRAGIATALAGTDDSPRVLWSSGRSNWDICI